MARRKCTRRKSTVKHHDRWGRKRKSTRRKRSHSSKKRHLKVKVEVHHRY